MKLIPNKALLKDKKVIFCDDSIVRTQLRDNVKDLYDAGTKEVHVRISCPPLVYGCKFVNFTNSKSDMELITRRVIKELEGDKEDIDLTPYCTYGTPQYMAMVEKIRDTLGVTTLDFNPIDNVVKAIGLQVQDMHTLLRRLKLRINTHYTTRTTYNTNISWHYNAA